MNQISRQRKRPSPEAIRAFFAASDGILDHEVLRPLSHIAPNWELTWDDAAERYVEENGSLAAELNKLIDELAKMDPPARYHDSEDRLARFVVDKLQWPIKKVRGRWVGIDYGAILEQGGYSDSDQMELLQASAGRIRAALDRDQRHFDEMEKGHRMMLGAVLAIVIFLRGQIDALSQFTTPG